MNSLGYLLTFASVGIAFMALMPTLHRAVISLFDISSHLLSLPFG